MKNKYEVLGIVGEGAYGIVYKCLNKETNKYVAVKKFKETHDKLVQKTMKRELAMLQMLRHENVVEFQESFVSKGNFFLVFEYVEKNLLEVLEESPKGLSPKLIRSFIFQMCKAVSYLHKNNMIHRDVKPENLLIDENLNLKLCDFGFARKVKLNKNNNNINEMTDYVATRWYRSPELLLSGGIYGPDVLRNALSGQQRNYRLHVLDGLFQYALDVGFAYLLAIVFIGLSDHFRQIHRRGKVDGNDIRPVYDGNTGIKSILFFFRRNLMYPDSPRSVRIQGGVQDFIKTCVHVIVDPFYGLRISEQLGYRYHICLLLSRQSDKFLI